MRRVLAGVFGLWAAAALPAAASGDFDIEAARAVFEARCSRCHGLDRPLKKNKSREGWKKTVYRMKRYAGGAISESDAEQIVEYLVRVRGPVD